MISSQYVGRVTLRRDKVESFDRYPFSLPAVRSLDQVDMHPRMTYFIGENGSGKSTLLEAIAVSLGFNAEGGTKNFSFGTRRSHSELHEYLRIAKGFRRPRDGYFLRAESFFNVATEIERLDEEPFGGPPIINSYGGRSLHEQSHGESFLALMTERFGGQGLYILDEPEAALSPQRQLAVLFRIHDLILDNSQFIIATHSPILMAYPDACIYQCDKNGVSEVAYEDTEHFKVTRSFLSNPQRHMQELRSAVHDAQPFNQKDLPRQAGSSLSSQTLGSSRMNPQVIAVSTSAIHAFSKGTALQIKLLAGLGVEGDAHCGVTVKHRSRVARDPTQPNLRQVHLIHAELFEELEAQGFKVAPGQIGENIATRNLNLLALPVDTELHIGPSAIVKLTGLRNPCEQLNQFQAGLTAAVLGRTPEGKLVRKAGVMGVVMASGVVQPGHSITVKLPAKPHRILERV